MKKVIMLIMLAAIAGIESSAQLSLSVSPGLNMNGATVGYKLADRFVPFAGFRFLRTSMISEYSGYQYSYTVNGQVDEVEYSDEASVNLMMPTIGLKTFLISKDKIKSFVTVSVTKPFLSAKYVEDGQVNQQVKEELRNISLFAGETGLGMEYFFDNHFSIGGEFGMRLLRVKYHAEHDDMIYNPFTGASTPSSHEHNYRFAFSPTYSKISLNFYF